MTERTLPVCGDSFDYRIPSRHAEKVSVADEYRHQPRQGEYIYVHKIPPEQVGATAYPEGAT